MQKLLDVQLTALRDRLESMWDALPQLPVYLIA